MRRKLHNLSEIEKRWTSEFTLPTNSSWLSLKIWVLSIGVIDWFASKSRRWWVRMFVNFLDAIMVNAYIIYKENFKIMNMSGPQNHTQPLEHDKFLSGVIHKLIGNFSCRRPPGPAPVLPFPLFHGRDHDSVNASQVWNMSPLLDWCKRSEAKGNWLWMQNLHEAFRSFCFPWRISPTKQYLLNIAQTIFFTNF